ncbi:putative repeat protein (TIGR01451 family)/predicted secreted protein (Por secretion system target) [Aquimarina sp. MAR_2010_214]|uniref:T9SS type A sorting domain-containing protein n=1 Tax=Aquimarina sp. MAR_2010_214 TaxID=1250026 RepID=UPI000C705406|nr:T9SS type A sorting domain-containing protein [Aquimarina sp. MAR_2010_214]PKV48750.1 putative repeat protein (TIGR01451 family)/predicted secreted protein (Por secretion system target) [Aquimarina sp. MAR_2010_214]
MKKLLCSIAILSSSILIAQVPFNPVSNSTMTIKGELKTIGNSIVGLNETLNGVTYTPNENYNGPRSNNQRTFGYIDIDNDSSTFSSSSANLNLSSGCERIAYAGLYWAASYFVDREGPNGNFIKYFDLPLPDSRPDFRTLKFKPPGETYITITPAQTQVIYNGYRNTPTNTENRAKSDIPYVCYADVTEIVKGLSTPDGTYTVADMRASTGFSGYNSNGISGGWILVVAYEDPMSSTKHISTEQGYIDIAPGDAPQTFTYSGFQTSPAPEPVNARYAIATLGGDRPYSGDIFQVEKPDGTLQDVFTTPANPVGNFFDSSISVNGSYVTSRNPASQNTLGFDADIFDISNPSNTVIGNDQNFVRFVTTSSGDAYSVFFSSFQVEVIEPQLMITERVLDVNGTNITGDQVNFGDQLFYEFTIENQGNEDIINASIRNILPANVDFIQGTIITSEPNIIATYNEIDREIMIAIDDDLLMKNKEIYTARFAVSVVANCTDLRDACSNEIINSAVYTYSGLASGITKTGEVLGKDACGFESINTSNTLINNNICSQVQSVSICPGSSLTLITDGGFSNYKWVDLSNPETIVGTGQSLDVSKAGTYSVYKSDNLDCRESKEIFEVTSYDAMVINQIISQEDKSVEISITGGTAPYIYELLDTSTSIVIIPAQASNTFILDITGNYTVHVQDANGCKAIHSFVFVEKIEDEENNKIVNNAEEFKIYPNPSSDIINVNTKVTSIKIYDRMGKLLIETTENTYNIANLRDGIYFVKILTKDKKEIITKIVKK